MIDSDIEEVAPPDGRKAAPTGVPLSARMPCVCGEKAILIAEGVVKEQQLKIAALEEELKKQKEDLLAKFHEKQEQLMEANVAKAALEAEKVAQENRIANLDVLFCPPGPHPPPHELPCVAVADALGQPACGIHAAGLRLKAADGRAQVHLYFVLLLLLPPRCSH